MPHYGTETRSSVTLCGLALDSTGQYSQQEIIKRAVPTFLSHCDSPSPNKKKPNKNKQNKQRSQAPAPAPAKEGLSWRRDSYRTNSESSDGSSHSRPSIFKLDSDKPRTSDNRIVSKPTPKQIKSDKTDKTFQIKTANKFDVIADCDDDRPINSDSTPVTPPENNPKPWFEKFEIQQPSNLVRRKQGNNES